MLLFSGIPRVGKFLKKKLEFSKSGFFKKWIFQNRKFLGKKYGIFKKRIFQNLDFSKCGFFKIWIFQNANWQIKIIELLLRVNYWKESRLITQFFLLGVLAWWYTANPHAIWKYPRKLNKNATFGGITHDHDVRSPWFLVGVNPCIKESPAHSKLLSFTLRSACTITTFSADSTFNTRLANTCVLLFKMFPRSHANFETTLPD